VTAALRPWTAVDELWYEYRDPWAEGAPGAFERWRELRVEGGWNVPFRDGVTFIADGIDSCADTARDELAAAVKGRS
jgi:hypothetical protein